MTSVTINDVPHSIVEGHTILQAARQVGIELPTLCSDACGQLNFTGTRCQPLKR
jgi:ferredoxin